MNNCIENDNYYRNEVSKFILNYPKQNYNEDWKLFASLTYRNPIHSDELGRRKIKGLVNHIKRKKINCSGLFTNELDINYNSIHHHLLLHSAKPTSKLKDEIWNYWRYNGWCDVQNIKDEKGVCIYFSKHLYKTEINDWEFIDLI